MRTNTDIEGIKRVAKLLLEMPVEVDKKFEFICHHPFIKDTYTPVPCEKTESNPAGMEMLDVRDQDSLERIKSFYIKGIDNCKKALDFFIVINKIFYIVCYCIMHVDFRSAYILKYLDYKYIL